MHQAVKPNLLISLFLEVNVYKLIVKDSVEEQILKLSNEKKRFNDAMLEEGKDKDSNTTRTEEEENPTNNNNSDQRIQRVSVKAIQHLMMDVFKEKQEEEEEVAL